MSQPHEPHGQAGAATSRNIFVRFQQGFERGFNRFRERYGRCSNGRSSDRSTFVTISLAIALGSFVLFFFLGRDYFPEIRSGVIQMHMRAPLGTRIEVSGRIATLVSSSIEELLPGAGRKHRRVIAACRSVRITSPSFRRRRSAPRIAI